MRHRKINLKSVHCAGCLTFRPLSHILLHRESIGVAFRAFIDSLFHAEKFMDRQRRDARSSTMHCSSTSPPTSGREEREGPLRPRAPLQFHAPLIYNNASSDALILTRSSRDQGNDLTAHYSAVPLGWATLSFIIVLVTRIKEPLCPRDVRKSDSDGRYQQLFSLKNASRILIALLTNTYFVISCSCLPSSVFCLTGQAVDSRKVNRFTVLHFMGLAGSDKKLVADMSCLLSGAVVKV